MNRDDEITTDDEATQLATALAEIEALSQRLSVYPDRIEAL